MTELRRFGVDFVFDLVLGDWLCCRRPSEGHGGLRHADRVRQTFRWIRVQHPNVMGFVSQANGDACGHINLSLGFLERQRLRDDVEGHAEFVKGVAVPRRNGIDPHGHCLRR